MKLLISILLLISVVVSGVTSFNLFYQFDYNTSAVLTIASYLSIVFCIYALTMGKNRPQDRTSSELLRHAPSRS